MLQRRSGTVPVVGRPRRFDEARVATAVCLLVARAVTEHLHRLPRADEVLSAGPGLVRETP